METTHENDEKWSDLVFISARGFGGRLTIPAATISTYKNSRVLYFNSLARSTYNEPFSGKKYAMIGYSIKNNSILVFLTDDPMKGNIRPHKSRKNSSFCVSSLVKQNKIKSSTYCVSLEEIEKVGQCLIIDLNKPLYA